MKGMTIQEARETRRKAGEFYTRQKAKYDETGLEKYLDDCKLAIETYRHVNKLIKDFEAQVKAEMDAYEAGLI